MVFVALIIVATSTSAINWVQDPAPIGFHSRSEAEIERKTSLEESAVYRWSMEIQTNSSDEKDSIFAIDLYQGATLSLITIVVKSQNETKGL